MSNQSRKNPFRDSPSGIAFPKQSPICLSAKTSHSLGQFCLTCKRINIPWAALPTSKVKTNISRPVGAEKTILAGIVLTDMPSIIQVAVATWTLLSNSNWETMIKVEPRIADPDIRRAADIVQGLVKFAKEKKFDIHYWDILEAALEEPSMTSNRYKITILNKVQAQPNYIQTRRTTRSGGQAQGQNSQEGTAHDKPTPNINIGHEAMHDDDDSDFFDDGEELEFTDQFPNSGSGPSSNVPSKNKPAPRGNWEFLTGQDLTDAKHNEPDPSKFFIARQDKDNHAKVDIRCYPRIANFDWNDKIHIESLNKARRQIKTRTRGAIAPAPLPWSEKEKTLLKREVLTALRKDYTKTNLRWDIVARNINAELKDVEQKQGDLLAMPSKWDSKLEKLVFPAKKNLKMLHDRTGSHRSDTGCRNQAQKFGDIAELLNNSDLPKNKRRTVDQMVEYLGGGAKKDAVQGTSVAPAGDATPITRATTKRGTVAGVKEGAKTGGSGAKKAKDMEKGDGEEVEDDEDESEGDEGKKQGGKDNEAPVKKRQKRA